MGCVPALAKVAATAQSHSAYMTLSNKRRKRRIEMAWSGDAKAFAEDARAASDEEQVPSTLANRGRLNVAALRRAVPIRTWGGKGSGLPCDYCRVLIPSDDVEYEVEAQLGADTVLLRFHYRCHCSWTGGDEPRVAADRA